MSKRGRRKVAVPKQRKGINGPKPSIKNGRSQPPSPPLPPKQNVAQGHNNNGGCLFRADALAGVVALILMIAFFIYEQSRPPATVNIRPHIDSGRLSKAPKVDTTTKAESDTSTEFSKFIYKSNGFPATSDTSRKITGILIKQLFNPQFLAKGGIRFRIGPSLFSVPARDFSSPKNIIKLSNLGVWCLPRIWVGVSDNRLYLSTDFYDAAPPHEKVGFLEFNNWKVVTEKVFPIIKSSDTSLLIQDKRGFKMFSVTYQDFGLNDCLISIDGYLTEPGLGLVTILADEYIKICVPYDKQEDIDEGLRSALSK